MREVVVIRLNRGFHGSLKTKADSNFATHSQSAKSFKPLSSTRFSGLLLHGLS